MTLENKLRYLVLSRFLALPKIYDVFFSRPWDVGVQYYVAVSGIKPAVALFRNGHSLAIFNTPDLNLRENLKTKLSLDSQDSCISFAVIETLVLL